MGRHKTNERGVLVASVIITIAVIAVLAWSGWNDYREIFDRGVQSTDQVARLAGEHTQRYIAAPEQALRRIDDYFSHRDPATIGSTEDLAYVRKVLDELPEADVIVIADRSGTAKLISHTHPTPPIDLSDRHYFFSHLQAQRPATVIGPLIKPRLPDGNDQYRFTVSRPLIRDGAFAGVVSASVFASRMEAFFKSLDFGIDSATAVLTRDGWIIARQEILPKYQSVNYADIPLFTEYLPRAPSGTYVRHGAPDGIERIYSYYALPDLPLVAVAGLPMTELAGEWRRQFARSALVALGLLIVTWGALWAVWHGSRRERALITHLEAALADNQVLFNEIHHRVKNNMQIISSMLMMEQVRSRDPVLTHRLETLAGRISSMALVHVMLYERHEASYVDMSAYLNELCANLSASFAAAERGISVIVDCDGSSLPMEKAVPVGLLINEAVSNAFKHAFPEAPGLGARGGSIRVMFAGGADGLHISVSDDGIGQSESASPEASGLGLTIMQALAGQLGGTAEFAPGNGTVFRVWCPEYSPSA